MEGKWATGMKPGKPRVFYVTVTPGEAVGAALRHHFPGKLPPKNVLYVGPCRTRPTMRPRGQYRYVSIDHDPRDEL